MDSVSKVGKEVAIENADEKPSGIFSGTIPTILLALFLALTVRSLAFEPFYIPSSSMKSNLLIGDYLFVSKYTYGYSRYSFPFGIKWFEGRVGGLEKPQRGDVVVFRFPPNPSIDYIKRIVGLPNDRVQVKDGILYINGKALERKYVDEFSDSENNVVETFPRFTEKLPEGKVITILKEKPPSATADYREVDYYRRGNNTPEFVVPEGKYFMMGDNRDNSSDSRFDVGFVPEENIVGRAEIIWFSTNGKASLLDPESWFKAMRPDRIFKYVD